MYNIVATLTREYLHSEFGLDSSSYQLGNKFQILSIPHLNTCFKHFIYFIDQFSLVEAKELAPLHELIQQFKERRFEAVSATASSSGAISGSASSAGAPSTSAGSHTPQGQYA